MNLALTGDLMLGRGVAEEIGRRAPESMWGDVRPWLLGADAVIGNLECAVTASGSPWTRWPKVFHFRAPPAAVDVLLAGGIRAVSLANNHILDYEVEGLRDTLRHLDAAGIAHAGAGMGLEEATRPAIVDAAGRRIGLIAFTDNEPGWAAGPDRPGVAYLPIRTEDRVLEAVARSVARARAAGADFVVLSLHWGPNRVERPPAAFRAFARAAMDMGADMIHGHSAHIVQGVEVHRRGPILYDTGDFVDDYAIDAELRNDLSFLFLASIDEAGVTGLRLLPVRLGYAQVDRAASADAAEIGARMIARSAELGAAAAWSDDSLRIPVRAPGRPEGGR